jgi:hypothetical protein
MDRVTYVVNGYLHALNHLTRRCPAISLIEIIFVLNHAVNVDQIIRVDVLNSL